MDFAQLKYLNTQNLYDTANGCAGLRDLFADGVAAVNKKSADLPESWGGFDSSAAVTKIAETSVPLDNTSRAFDNAQQTLTTLAVELDTAKAELGGLIAQATAIPAFVDDFGGVTPLNPLDPSAPARAAAVAAQIVALVARANQHDAAAQTKLASAQNGDGAPAPDDENQEQEDEKEDNRELIHDGIRLANKALSLLNGGGTFGGQEYGGNSLASEGLNGSLGQVTNAGSGALASGAATYGGTSYGAPGTANGFGGTGGGGFGGMSGGMGAAGSGRSGGSAMTSANGSGAPVGATTDGAGRGAAGGGGAARGGMMGGGAGRAMGSDSDSGGGTSANSWLHEDRDPFTTDAAAPPVVGMRHKPAEDD